MEQRDREQIDNCCENVVSKIDMEKLLPRLLQNKVYNHDDINMSRWKKDLTAPDTVKDIYLTIKTRGPHAFKNLILSLRESDHANVADILEGKTSINSSNFNEDDYPYHNHSADKPLIIKLRKAIKFLDRENEKKIIKIARYRMRSNPRGLVLIISNIFYHSPEDKPRLSAKHDTDNLRTLFEEMGFKVFVKYDLTGQQIKEEISKFSKLDELAKVDSCFVIITSHGTEDKDTKDIECSTEIQGIDFHNASSQPNYEKVLCSDIYNYFTAEACPQLAEKPKIFIFQLCRGKRMQKAVAHSRTAIDSCVISNNNYEPNVSIPWFTIRNYSDMLIVQSSLPGYVSYRDNVTGSWFIHYICSTFMNHAWDTHIQDLFTMVDAHIKMIRTGDNECQTSCIQSWGFNKHLYLNPGLFEES